MLTCGLSRWLELDSFPWIVNNKGGTFSSVSCENPHAQISLFSNNYITVNESDGFANCRDYWEGGAGVQRCCTQSSCQPSFPHSTGLFSRFFSPHLPSLFSVTVSERERKTTTETRSDASL